MVGCYHRVNEHEFEQVGDGQGSLAGYSPQNRKELDTSEATEHADNWNI